MATKIIPASANEVRNWFVANSAKVPAGDKTVGKPVSEHRGKLSATAREVFATATGRAYVPGTRDDLIELEVSYTQPSGKKAKKVENLTVKEIRALAGETAKTKGRLNKDALAAAAEKRGAQITAESAERAAAKRTPKAEPKVTEPTAA